MKFLRPDASDPVDDFYSKQGKVEAYLLGALKEWRGWRIRGFRLMHFGDDEVLPEITEGGFPEITNEHVVR